MKFTIVDNVPIPRDRLEWGFPLVEMKVGQAILVDTNGNTDEHRKGLSAARNAVQRCRKADKKLKFRVVVTEEGFGIWRTK